MLDVRVYMPPAPPEAWKVGSVTYQKPTGRPTVTLIVNKANMINSRWISLFLQLQSQSCCLEIKGISSNSFLQISLMFKSTGFRKYNQLKKMSELFK